MFSVDLGPGKSPRRKRRPSPPMKSLVARGFAACALTLLLGSALPLRGENMVQYFNTPWSEITAKMPELAEAGYDAIWLPPPTKGSGGLSVGYDLFDRFDLGSKDQRGSISTRYGTEGELLRLIETAHRFGIRVYLDNVMNHNAFDVPGYNASTPIDIYPGFVPEDFHLRLTQEGFYRKWDNIRDYNSAWQVQHLGLADLIDIAQEPGATNENFGYSEGDTFQKIKFVRQPSNPEYYCYKPDGSYVGFGPNNGITVAMLTDPANFNLYGEYVQDFLNRSARWLIDRTKADGLRLDAVKHVRYDFFGASFGTDKDYNDYGYLGQAQRQFAITRGFNDSRFNSSPQGTSVNLRESVFDTEKPRHNAMMFGEHLGEPPPYGDYFNVGMRLVDNVLRSNLNNILGNPSANLNGLDGDGSYGFASSLAVMHAQSHDNDYASRRELQHALYFTRAGIGLIYTDGNHQAQTLGQSGGAFPRHANTNFLGQFNDNRIPNLLYIHNQFARGYQAGRWSDADVVAYERIDKRENTGMSDEDGVTLLFMMNDNYANGQGRTFNTAFGHTALGDNAYLYNYSSYGGGFYKFASDIVNGSTIVPPGGYFAFSWKNPDPSDLWAGGGGQPITILQGGSATSTLTYLRKDGPDGDPNFNPYSVAGAVPGSYSYPYTVPRVTDASDLSFTTRVDGSAENVLLELDGGVDLNGTGPASDPTGKRDHPPGLSTDVFVGYEQPSYVDREGPEKFAAIDTARCTFGSAGAETYTAGGTTVNGSGVNPQDAAAASFVYHDPNVGFDGWTGTHPATQFVDNGSTFDIWAKTNSVGAGFRMFAYYTSDGSNPEGAGGVGIGSTKTAEMTYQAPNTSDGGNYWTKASAARPAGTLKYKIGIFKTGQVSVFPVGATEASRKTKMMTTFQVAHFNGNTAVVYPHDDFATTQTGLTEGFHVLRARAFLNRAGKASIYNTFTQTFYYDALPPQGEVKFPTEGSTIGGSRYGVVVRTDPSVTEVWYHIDDGDSSNDDSSTRTQAGNGSGFEPFTDSNANGIHDASEPFIDLNGNGVWDSAIATTWVKATEVTPNPQVSSTYPREWRFDYVNIPASGTAQIKVRLREASSAEYKDFALTDAAGHYTTLVRNVTAAGPATRMFVSYPANDGDLVDSSYVMKVWFSKSLADGIDEQTLISRFLIKIANSESGSAANAVAQSRASYHINYNATSDYHELAYQLPNLYNGTPDFLHTLDATFTATGLPALEATRLVRARPVTTIKDNIINPPEVDADGKTYQIILPDVANPSAADRAVPIRVETDLSATNVEISFALGGGSVTLNAGSASSPNPSVVGSTQLWDFTWNNVGPGDYQFVSTVTTPSGIGTAARNAHVVYRQLVAANASRHDVDDDGLGWYNGAPIETTAIPLPTTNSETWTNADVHLWVISGRTNPLSPDTDGDGLSDGLELGWASAVDDTNATTDTNGDGVPNFQPDLDPPIYNTTDNVNAPVGYEYFNPWPYNLNRSRTDQIAGSITDPNKADTEGDGVNDGLEDLTLLVRRDANNNPILDTNGHVTYRKVHNGRVDILPSGSDGEMVIKHPPTIYNTSTVDRNRVTAVSPNAVWLETDPNNVDTDGDGATDGQEDANHNGIVDLAIIDRNQTDVNGNYVVLATISDPLTPVTVTPSVGGVPQTFYYADFCYTYAEPTDGNTYGTTALSKAKLNAVFRPGGVVRADQLDVIWLETDPRRFSTSGDTLPDGWKLLHGLDPFDDGVVGHYNLRTGKLITNTDNGPAGDPDGDGINNYDEYTNGTDPRVNGTPPPPPPGSITIGPGASTTVGGVTNTHEFTDWKADDLIALDPYDGDGSNNQQSDIYHGYDGFDSSRDMVAFYAHDGGDPGAVNPNTGQNGDGNFYFRVDMQDLQAYAEQGNLDIYVVINFGNPGTGEFNLPDQVDTGTSMKWQAVVAAYQTNNGRVYLWDKNAATHTTGIGQDLFAKGVTVRDQNTANGFKKAYYSSDLDAVEFSISRQALLDAGWNGNPNTLIYQVFTTKDGTSNSPVGAGDIGGRSDIRDSIRNDWIASDYYLDQPNITGANSVLTAWVGLQADNDRGKRVKVMSIIHGNQAIQPGTAMQSLINNTLGAGYYRPLDVHEAFGAPFAMHITPTLASAIQWAKVDAGSPRQYRDGPALNARIAGLINTGTLDLLGSTFADHILPYFSSAYTQDNIALANDFLTSIYGHAPSSQVFWTPERASNADVLQKVSDAGFTYSFLDQMRHIFKWFGRSSALGSDGYRVNQIGSTKTFVINDGVSSQLFTNTDNGAPILLRQLLSRKARDGTQDQVVTFVNQWEDFAVKANADAYDKNIRWLASHPWIQIVTPDQIASGAVTFNGVGSPQWGAVSRGSPALSNVAKDFVDHATEENYDHWFSGSALEESLTGKQFNIRTGVPMQTAYGTFTGSGILASTWQSVSTITNSAPNAGILSLARATMGAAGFETAFHDQANNDLSKFSTGAYITPDSTFQSLAGFSKFAQAQTRTAAIYARVSTWAAAAALGNYFNTSVAEQADVDLDGESEYLLYNDRIFALFERIGGRMTAAWLRDINSGFVSQVVGNQAGYAGSETELEGGGNFVTDAVNAFRTSGFKDWFSKTDNSGTGTFTYVNDLYVATPAASGIGWTFTSSDGKIAKTITLGGNKNALQASYTTSGMVQLYVRFGLSPNLLDLLEAGQTHLGSLLSSASETDLFNNSPARNVRAYLRYGGVGYSGTSFNAAASDIDAGIIADTIPMRNQAQTQQAELQGVGTMNFSLGFETGSALSYDTDADGLPDYWTLQHFGHNIGQAGDLSRPGDDSDGDGLTNYQEYLLGTNPTVADSAGAQLNITRTSTTTIALTFTTIQDRIYQVLYSTDMGATWLNAGSAINGNGVVTTYTDDGSGTGSPPAIGTKRFYKLQVSLNPQP